MCYLSPPPMETGQLHQQHSHSRSCEQWRGWGTLEYPPGVKVLGDSIHPRLISLWLPQQLPLIPFQS